MLTAGFLHGNLIHIATNMMSLYILGHPAGADPRPGRFVDDLPAQPARFVGQRDAVQRSGSASTIGASGAVYGLMGALLVTFKRLGYDLRQLIVVLAINV